MSSRFGPAALCAAIAFASAPSRLAAEPPHFLSADPPAAAPAAEPAVPIPAAATPEQLEEFADVIAESRENDVSVTDQHALMYHGLMLTQDEEYEEAVPFLEEAIRRDPSLQAAWEGLGWSYVKLGDLDHAGKLWEYFRRLMPEESLPHALLAQLAVLNGDWKTADAEFAEALRISPDQYDVRFWYGQNLMRLGRAAEAETLFRELLAENDERLDVAVNLASLLTQRLAYDEAVELYRRINDEIPGNTSFMLDQAILEERVGELRAADQLCLDVLELDPANTRAMVLRADIAEISGQQDVRPVLDIIDETEDPQARAMLRIRVANRCHVANERRPGQYPTSFILDLIRKAIDDQPANVEYRVLYAERLLGAGRNEECRKWAIGILENDNRHHVRAKMLLFELAMREKRYDDALQILVDRYVDFDSTDPAFHYYKARLMTARGDFAGALREIDAMEAAARQGAVFTLAYTGLAESDWTPSISVRRLHEHLLALQREGFTLVSPADIPQLVGLAAGESRADAPLRPDVPMTARLIDDIRYGLTGERRFPASRDGGPDDVPRPHKYFAVTFDADQRSAVVLGTPVAQEFGVPFAIFTPTKTPDEFVPSRTGWQELRDAAASGAWVVGSQLWSADFQLPVDRDGLDVRPPLANRVWLPEKNRLESMNEWDRRMREEFRRSRRVLREEMGADDCPVPLVAYPYSAVGQNGACNLSLLRNPSRSILSEAAREYRVGFLQDDSGWTVGGDDLALARRWAPDWRAEGADVVRHAYETHPEFVARRMRAEIAMMMNRPNLAARMLELLRRDGYPEDLCRAMENQLRFHFSNKPLHDVKPLVEVGSRESGDEAPEREDAGARDPEPGPGSEPGGESATVVLAENPDEFAGTDGRVSSLSERENVSHAEETSVDPLVYLSHPWIGVEAMHSKANDQVESYGWGLRAGLDLNRNTSLSVRMFDGYLDQTVRPRWNAVIATNVPYGKRRYEFKAKREETAVTLSHRLGNGAVLSASVGVASRKPTGRRPDFSDINLEDESGSRKFDPAEDDSHLIASLGARWHPRDNLELSVLYDRNYVQSAVKYLPYHAVSAGADWKPRDDWFLRTFARYSSYDDDNAMFSGRFEAFHETNQDLGIWLGVQLTTDTTSDPCDFYWTPYWDERAMGVLRYAQRWEGYSFRLDLLGGFSRSRGRPGREFKTEEDVEKVVYVEGVANTVTETKEGTYVMEDASSGWSVAWGVNGTYERSLNPYFDLVLEGSITALRDYIDHTFTALLRLRF